MSLIQFILAFVSSAIWPLVYSISLFHAIYPFALVFLSVFADVCAQAMNFAISELSFKAILVDEEHSFPIFLLVQEFTYISAAISILRLATSIGHIIFPLPFIFISIDTIELAMPICLIIFDFSFVIASISFYNPPLPLTPAIHKCPLQIVIILKIQFTKPMRLPINHLPNKFGLHHMIIIFLLLFDTTIITSLSHSGFTDRQRTQS